MIGYMDLKHIAAKLEEVDLQELLVRYVMNDAVRELRANNRPITWVAVSRVIDERMVLKTLLDPSTLQPMFELVSGQYMKGGWKEQIPSDGIIIHLTPDEVSVVFDDLQEENAQDRAAYDSEPQAYEKDEELEVKSRMHIRATLMGKLA